MNNFSSSEDLWFGEVSDEKDRNTAAKSLAALTAKVHGVRAFPASAAQLMKLSGDPNFSVKATAKTIEADPAMAARVLRLVNSAAYALVKPCKSIPQAVMLLGARKIAEVAAAAAVVDLFHDESEQSVAVLRHAAGVAFIARHLANLVNVSPDDMFTCGLLHDVGKLMLLQVGDDDYASLLERLGDERDAIHVHERMLYGFDHAVLAGAMLSDWKIPDPIPRVVGWHHNPARAYRLDKKIGAMIHLLRLADQLASTLIAVEVPELTTCEDLARGEAATCLGISAFSLEREWKRLRRGVVESQNAFGLSGDGAPPSMHPAPPASEEINLRSKQAAEARCVACGNEAFGHSCARCRGALCATHDPGRNPCCVVCEREYAKRVSSGANERPMRAVSWAFCATAIGLESYGMGAAFAPAQVAGLVSLLLCGAALAAIRYQRWVRRAAFLAEKPRHRPQ